MMSLSEDRLFAWVSVSNGETPLTFSERLEKEHLDKGEGALASLRTTREMADFFGRDIDRMRWELQELESLGMMTSYRFEGDRNLHWTYEGSFAYQELEKMYDRL